MESKEINQKLNILGWGTYLPPTKPVEEMVRAAGGDVTNYLTFGWKKVCVALEDDYPLGMCTKALESALKHANIEAKQLDLVICTSTTHDYIEFCTASDVIKNVSAEPTCVGFDVYQGCVTTLTALEIALGWFSTRGSGYAAIVSAERWAEGIDKRDNKVESMWNYGDGSSALIVSLGTPQVPKVIYGGTRFYNSNEMSGHIRRAFAGTRHPYTPPEECPTKRLLLPTPLMRQIHLFWDGYNKVIADYKKTFQIVPDWLICNQGTPAVVEQLSYMTKVKPDRVAATGRFYGHIGCSDLIIALQHMEMENRLSGKGIALACSPSCWGAALLEA